MGLAGGSPAARPATASPTLEGARLEHLPGSFSHFVPSRPKRQSHQVSSTINKATKLVATTDIKYMVP